MKLICVRIMLLSYLLLFMSSLGVAFVQTVEELKFVGDPSPVKIIGYKFGEGDSVLKDMVIEVKNVSSKPVYYFFYKGILPVSSSDTKPITIHFFFNKELQQELMTTKKISSSTDQRPLMPGETVKLSPSDKFKTGIATLSSNITDVSKVNLVLQHSYYGDGTYWIGGTTLPRNTNIPADINNNHDTKESKKQSD